MKNFRKKRSGGHGIGISKGGDGWKKMTWAGIRPEGLKRGERGDKKLREWKKNVNFAFKNIQKLFKYDASYPKCRPEA